MTLTSEQARTYVGRAVFDFDHEMVGAVDAIYFCDATGLPTWFSFTTDFFAERDAFVPAGQVSPFSEGITIPIDRGLIRSMPRIKPRNGALSSAQVARLHEFFGTFSGEHFASAHEARRSSPSATSFPIRTRCSADVPTRRRSVPGCPGRTSRTTSLFRHREPRTLRITPGAAPSCPVFRPGSAESARSR